MVRGETRGVFPGDELRDIAGRFARRGKVTDIAELGSGNVNDTFLVTLEGAEMSRFVLQRVNRQVFRRPELVMLNMKVTTEHILDRLRREPSDGRRREVPEVLLTGDGSDHVTGPDGSFWRAVAFIDKARSFDRIRDEDHAREVGWAVGTFHRLISDLPPDRLEDTLEGFHVTPRYLLHFDHVCGKGKTVRTPDERYCLRFVTVRRDITPVLEEAKRLGLLKLRPIHGDPKVDNVMIDDETGRAVGMVDFDTVKPGLVQYDIGDCLRSGCNPPGEETLQWDVVRFEPDLCRAVLQGYIAEAREFLAGPDYDFIYDAVRLIAFELGLRFFTDHLEGDVYFKVRHRGQNLARALVQFRLTASIESQEPAIRAIIRDQRRIR